MQRHRKMRFVRFGNAAPDRTASNVTHLRPANGLTKCHCMATLWWGDAEIQLEIQRCRDKNAPQMAGRSPHLPRRLRIHLRHNWPCNVVGDAGNPSESFLSILQHPKNPQESPRIPKNPQESAKMPWNGEPSWFQRRNLCWKVTGVGLHTQRRDESNRIKSNQIGWCHCHHLIRVESRAIGCDSIRFHSIQLNPISSDFIASFEWILWRQYLQNHRKNQIGTFCLVLFVICIWFCGFDWNSSIGGARIVSWKRRPDAIRPIRFHSGPDGTVRGREQDKRRVFNKVLFSDLPISPQFGQRWRWERRRRRESATARNPRWTPQTDSNYLINVTNSSDQMSGSIKLIELTG